MFKLPSFFRKKLALHSLLFSTLFSTYSFAAIDMANFSQSLPQGTNLSFIAKNLQTQQIIAEQQIDSFMLPASTQKVFTALAAKLVLSDQFQFTTTLLTNGSISNGILEGDLIVRFTGDPDLTSGQLYNLLAQLKSHKINQIKGNLVVDTSVFSSHDRASGWIWNDLTMCFNSPPAAANIDNNCFNVDIDATQPVGEIARFNVASHFPIQVFGQVHIVDKTEANYCQLDAVVHDNNRYQIKGCIARQAQPFGLSFAVQDPDAYASAIIQRQLKQLGIRFDGNVLQATTTSKGEVLAEHLSKPLPDLIRKMLKKSDNQIADTLFRTVASQYYQRPASFQLASKAIKEILKQRAGIEFGHSIIADGSGLSRHNLISVQTMLQALDFIAYNDKELKLIDSFPTAGHDGTLSGRGSMTTAPLANNIKAKTGALKGVYNLAGFMTNHKGEQIAFVQFINGYSTGELDNKIQRAPLVKFEQGIYNAIYNYDPNTSN